MTLVFTGAQQNTITTAASLLGETAFTVMFWAKIYSGSPDGVQAFVNEYSSGGARSSFKLYLNAVTSGGMQGIAIGAEKAWNGFLGLSSGVVTAVSNGTVPIIPDTYIHFCATLSSNVVNLYINGVPQTASSTNTNTFFTSVSNTIGAARTANATWTQYFRGEILDYRHYTVALPADQISTIACSSGLDFITQNIGERHIMFGVPGNNATQLDDWSANNRDRTVSTTIPFG